MPGNLDAAIALLYGYRDLARTVYTGFGRYLRMLKYLSISLVILGVAMLLASLYPARTLYRDDQVNSHGWRALMLLIVFFVWGYIAYTYILVTKSIDFVNLAVSLILFGGGIFVTLIIRMSIISIRNSKRIAALERHRALHDQLTDLPNRVLLYERIDQAIKDARRGNNKIAVLIMDLDRFKEINDTLGHQCGDALLQQVAPRLKSAVRESDTVARLGGDEFAVVLPKAGLEESVNIAEKISLAIDGPFIVEGHNLNVGISIGIALYPDDGIDSQTLVRRADVAMYVAKRSEQQYSVYTTDQDQYTLNRLMLIGELRHAISEKQLVVYYQPKVNIQQRRVCGVEALVRWQHPQHGLLLPESFIDLAEKAGLIRGLTMWVIEETARQASEWQRNGVFIPVSVNLSIKNLQDKDLSSQIENIIRKNDLRCSSYTLEITESSMMSEPDKAYEVISQLSKLGLNLSIDDFGTGYSSLAYLKQLPAGEIKIDKSFIIDMMEDDNDAVIVRSIIDLSHNMGRKVTAEGVESKDIYDLLEILGCDMAQGYHVCKPLPPDELFVWLLQSKWLMDKDMIKPFATSSHVSP